MDGRVDCLIFSKDRPAQLECLLASIEKRAKHLYSRITILLNWSSRDFEDGYQAIYHILNGGWFVEIDFENDVRLWLANAGETVSFLCDDDVFYADAPPLERIRLPWSLRGGDFDYPFSLDGNIYRRGDIVTLLDGLRFRNPTELEHQGHLHRDRLSFAVVNHGEPCLVGVPLNRVSASSSMPHAGFHEFDLNERFLAGERLRLPLPANGGPYGTHVIVDPAWEKDGARV